MTVESSEPTTSIEAMFGNFDSVPNSLPLEIFDDESTDCRTPADWLGLGWDKELNVFQPIPGHAILPVKNKTSGQGVHFDFCHVMVLEYDKQQNLYLVQRSEALEAGNELCWLPRLYLLFLADDPVVFVHRFASACAARRSTQARLRYNLYIDCMAGAGPSQELPEGLLASIRTRVMGFGNPHLKDIDRQQTYLTELESQVERDFRRAMDKLEFDHVVAHCPESFPPLWLPPQEECRTSVVRKGTMAVPWFPFMERREVIRAASLFTNLKALAALDRVMAECIRAASQSLFLLFLGRPLRLNEFVQIQGQHASKMELFLNDVWISSVLSGLCSALVKAERGWMDIRQNSIKIYKMSKLYKLMEVIRFAMQSAIRSLVLDSLLAFVQFVSDACLETMDCPDDLTWNSDFINSPYKPKTCPIFIVDLVLEPTGVRYSTPFENFETTVHSLFNNAILASHKIPHVEKFIMKNLFITGTPLLESVGLREQEVEELRSTLRKSLGQAIIPLRAYAAHYQTFMPLLNLNVEQFAKQTLASDRPSSDVCEDLHDNLRQCEHVDVCIPSDIVIGPFLVTTESARQTLCSKYQALVSVTLELYAQNLKQQANEVIQESMMITHRASIKPSCVEELVEHREWLSSKSELLSFIQDKIKKLQYDHELFEDFHINLSQDIFDSIWTAIGWPHLISQHIESVLDDLNEDEENFRNIQLKDEVEFLDRLETLQITVVGFSMHADLGKAHKVAEEARLVASQLKEAREKAQLYASRQKVLGLPSTDFECAGQLVRDFVPFHDIWCQASYWQICHKSWLGDPLETIEPEQVENNLSDMLKTVVKCARALKDAPECESVAQTVRTQIEEFRPLLPLLHALRNPGMHARHWALLSESLQMNVQSHVTEQSLAQCLERGLDQHTAAIAALAEVAQKEYTIEQALNKIESEWAAQEFEVLPYKSTGTYILCSPDEALQLLDDHLVMIQSMAFSPHRQPFEELLSSWDIKLRLTQDVLEEWLACQRAWLYLEPIFSSEDIIRQLPVESKHYQTVDDTWRMTMKSTNDNRQIIDVCPDEKLLESLKEGRCLLEQVQKGLSHYLETKRAAFPRFYFLSDDELLEILSQTRDPTAVQPHLRNCYENIAWLCFEDDLSIWAMRSGEGEQVSFCETIHPTGNVEDWLREVETTMRASIRDSIRRSLDAYPLNPRTEWVLSWPGQVVIAARQIYWTLDVSQAIELGTLTSKLCPQLAAQLGDLVALVRGPLSYLQRGILGALIVIEVHARDVATSLSAENVHSVNDFEWISQLRYYWSRDDLFVHAVNAEFLYGYEYLGNSGRLVITPLTDRCYLTLTGALHLKFGGAPAGPAGTGKTETTKDLGKALAIQTVVFNCSDQLDFLAMGKLLKGLASSGAWACFDEFNRIDVEVLSVVAQQIATIQKAQQQRVKRFIFEGVEIPLVPSCAVFITMNPGYAGRTELPDNLKALFRPVAMMVPDYTMIAEISLYSFGFSDAKTLAKKVTSTFKLSSEQLSSQDHYDFGMRAVKTVLCAAGNLKRENPDMDEELICLHAICDVNVPKFLADDLKLFAGVVADLFPGTRERDHLPDHGALPPAIRATCTLLGLKDVQGFLDKCIQLYETTIVRHGLMLVGPTGSAKTKCYKVLAEALTSLKGQRSLAGGTFETVHISVLNPKSITMGQLYGEFDLLTHEWTDGILSSLIRVGAASMDSNVHWYVFDGPVDAVWIENMNTVLDDNKKLCLSSGEIIKLTEYQRLIFEVADLAVASPATVSRCGMVYLEPGIVGLIPLTECWLRRLPSTLQRHISVFQHLFNTFLEASILFVRSSVHEALTSVDSNLVCSLLRLLDCFIAPFVPIQGERALTKERLDHLRELLEPWFLFSLVWSVGATADGPSRAVFSRWLHNKIADSKVHLPFPSEGLVYDYRLDDGGIGNLRDDDALTDEGERPVRWVSWMSDTSVISISKDTPFADIIVPTADTIRSSHLLHMLLSIGTPVLCVGPTGTGKTLIISNKLLRNMPGKFVSHFIIFSARTTANQTQDLIDGKLDKRRKGVFGPPLGKSYVFFIDDLNMPALEAYGAQPPLELLRQWMDHGGWYDRKQIGMFQQLVDINFACAMGPPGGGRNPVTARLTRHFHQLSFPEMDDCSLRTVFSTIFRAWIDEAIKVQELADGIITSTLAVYSTVTAELLPTPAKSHYTFNVRDLSKVFQGMLMANPGKIEHVESLLQLWVHESRRVFRDRLTCDEDRVWLDSLLAKQIQHLGATPDNILPGGPLLYGDFVGESGVDTREYARIDDFSKLAHVVDEFLEEYNQTGAGGGSKMRLVLFEDALEHLCRIARVLRQPLGNALLLGVGGSGKQSLTRLASYIAEYDCFQVELSKTYGVSEWREDLRKLMFCAGVNNTPLTFLFTDTQIKCESFLEDINNVLNSGDVPNIYGVEEQERIFNAMRGLVQETGQPSTKANLMAAYTKRVRTNTHLVLCMSPLGEIFRARLRQFPSLVTCCTIDWFSPWPKQALTSVASSFLHESTVLETYSGLIPSLAHTCVAIHQAVEIASVSFLTEIGRHNHVTPSNYLELLDALSRLLGQKRTELQTARYRMDTGLTKLLRTSADVTMMQEDLETMRPLLEEAARETEVTMEKIQVDTVVAEKTRVSVRAEEAKASDKAELAQAIADDAQRDLDEALPALEAALTSLKSLNKNDVTEVRGMQHPPPGVKMVVEAVCIMKGVKPKRIPGEKPGTKVDDYWEPGKGLLQDPGKFLESLFKYDKDNIPEAVIRTVSPYIESEEFMPAAISKVSKACTSICLWVRAMYKYHFISRAVKPKRQALQEAQEDLEKTQKVLDEAKSRLEEVERGIAALQRTYSDCVTKRKQLEERCVQCEQRLLRAGKLIGGLKDERVRWQDTIAQLDDLLSNIIGDVLLSAASVVYLGPFSGEYRARLTKQWLSHLDEFEVPHSREPTLVGTFGDPLKIQSWQIAGLPKDTLSVENSLLMQFSRNWPLFIDPQGQANRWIKNLERNLDVLKLSDRDLMRSLENAVRFGKPCLLENVAEDLDPSLEPILLHQTFLHQGVLMIRLGDSVIPYHEDFHLYITTKLPNPHYTPERCTKVTLINFTLSPSGLEDQLLCMVVAKERPDLEEAKNQLIISGAKMRQDLEAIEDRILQRLSSSEGNPVDDEELIQVLEASKMTAADIKAKVASAEQTEKHIDVTRMQYIPVAVRTRILFFCVTDMANVDPMYQYSLDWFLRSFVHGIASSERADSLEERINNINEYFTFALYSRVCRSLFEQHKPLFAVLVCARILIHSGQLNSEEWQFLLTGGAAPAMLRPNPAPEWLSERAWRGLQAFTALPRFQDLAADLPSYAIKLRPLFDSHDPQCESLSKPWSDIVCRFARLLLLRCLRADRITGALQNFVAVNLGQRFIEPQASSLDAIYQDSSPGTPLIFVLSTGTDPASQLYSFADKMNFGHKLNAISLGQGQGPRAEEMMQRAMDQGTWVFFQNCHLAPSWMISLERLIEGIDPEKVHREFRLWLTSLPSAHFPVSVLQSSSKMTVEPPRGVKANLLRSYLALSDEMIDDCSKPVEFKALLFSLCLFHAVTLERRKFGPLGFNIPYEFTDGDLKICMSQLRMFLNEYDDIPYKVLRYTAGQINYGGRVTDNADRRCITHILEDFYTPAVLEEGHSYSQSGLYRHIGPLDLNAHLQYIRELPINEPPELFGLHDNANITFAQNEAFALLGTLLCLQPRPATGTGDSREETVQEKCQHMIDGVPLPFDISIMEERFPLSYEESMNTVLTQEVIRYNRLLLVVRQSLEQLSRALQGLVVMSLELEQMADSLYINSVPNLWKAKAYPSLKALASWIGDLVQRVHFLQCWIDDGPPPVFWISGFFFPQAFLTGTLQNYSRQEQVPIDTLSFNLLVLEDGPDKLQTPPDVGCRIHGLFLEGARWSSTDGLLAEPYSKELHSSMAVLWLIPTAKCSTRTNVYCCPIYKTLTRAGTLSTTGHSTNYVTSVDLPTDQPAQHWIKRGTALICALD